MNTYEITVMTNGVIATHNVKANTRNEAISFIREVGQMVLKAIRLD